jgi:hypothetical protein
VALANGVEEALHPAEVLLRHVAQKLQGEVDLFLTDEAKVFANP